MRNSQLTGGVLRLAMAFSVAFGFIGRIDVVSLKQKSLYRLWTARQATSREHLVGMFSEKHPTDSGGNGPVVAIFALLGVQERECG